MEEPQERFEQVFNGCYEPVLRYAARRVPAEAVQDVVAETFLIAWRRRGQLDGDPLPWLYGIARRVAANTRRGSDRRQALSERLRAQERGEESIDPGLRDAWLARAMGGLGDRDREALMLIAWEELDHRQAARVMGCSTGAFAVRVHRARRRLARALAEEGNGLIDTAEEARA